MPEPQPDLEAAAIVEAFNKHRVRYVVIGAFAAIAQHAPIPATRDIDLTPEKSDENLARLSAALKGLGARIRTSETPEGLPFSHDAASLAAVEVWNLVCTHGEFDIMFRPAGFEAGYSEIVKRSHVAVVDGVEVVVADIDDVIYSKEAAGRPKDLRLLPILYRHRDSTRPDT